VNLLAADHFLLPHGQEFPLFGSREDAKTVSRLEADLLWLL
jgi:hypothetical protein